MQARKLPITFNNSLLCMVVTPQLLKQMALVFVNLSDADVVESLLKVTPMYKPLFVEIDVVAW